MQRKLIRKDKWKYGRSFIASFIPPSSYIALLALSIGTCGIIVSDHCYAESAAGITIDDNINSASETIYADYDTVVYSNIHKIKISANNIENYTLIISGDTNLKNKEGIATTIGSVGQNIEGKNIAPDTWGYTYADANTITSENIASMPFTGLNPDGISIAENKPVANHNLNFTIDIAFAAKFSNVSSGGYYGKVVLSLITTPRRVAGIGEWVIPDTEETILDSGIRYMQDTDKATTEGGFCPDDNNIIPIGSIITLKDRRDEKTYNIAKLPIKDSNGKSSTRCWMTQNLALRGETNLFKSADNTDGKTLTSADTNLPDDSTWILPATLTELNKTSPNRNFSSDQGYYTAESYITIPSNNIDEDINTTNPDTRETGYYSYAAATAGTTGQTAKNADGIIQTITATVTSGNAKGSICPKGWILPTGNITGEFYGIFNGADIIYKDSSGKTLAALATSGASYYLNGLDDYLSIIKPGPYNFTLPGYVDEGVTSGAGLSGRWWSSTIYSGTIRAYSLGLSGTAVYPVTSGLRYSGNAIRCIAQ